VCWFWCWVVGVVAVHLTPNLQVEFAGLEVSGTAQRRIAGLEFEVSSRETELRQVREEEGVQRRALDLSLVVVQLTNSVSHPDSSVKRGSDQISRGSQGGEGEAGGSLGTSSGRQGEGRGDFARGGDPAAVPSDPPSTG